MAKRKIVIMAVLLVGLLASNAFAGIEGKVSLALVDGTRINGWLTDESIEFEASFGKVTIRRDQIVSLARLQDNNYKLSLKDGSVLMGKVTSKTINVASKLGQLQIKPGDISCLSVGNGCGNSKSESTYPVPAAYPESATPAPVEKSGKAWWEKK